MKIVKFTNAYTQLASGFDCGNYIINNFLRSGDALDENQGVTYILLSEDMKDILGFYNITVERIDQVECTGSITRYIPMGGAININYLAVSVKFQHTAIAEGFYFGDYLLQDCENRICQIRKTVGAMFVTIYSTDEGYHLYHDRNSYEIFEDDMNTFVSENNKNSKKLYKWIDDIDAEEYAD